jgi:hypothetical protein
MSISSQNEPTQPIRVPSAPKPIPTGIQRNAPDHDLGPIVAVYPSRPKGFEFFLVVLMILVITSLIPFLYGIWSGFQGYINYGLAVIIPRSAGWIGFSLITILLIFLFLIRSADRSLAIYRKGILLRKALFVLLPERNIRAYYWHQLKGITTLVGGKKPHRLQGQQSIPHVQRATIYPSNGNPIRLYESNRIRSAFRGSYSVSNLADLCTQSKALLYKVLLPQLHREFAIGQEVRFGPVIIQEKYLQFRKTGLSHRHMKVAWDQVIRLTIEAGKLMIELDEGKSGVSIHCIPVSRIPNVELMLNIIDRQVG